MPRLMFCFILMLASAAYGQGTINFNNRIPGVVDGRFLFSPEGPGFGVGFTAQLVIAGGPSNLPFTRLTPTTTFRTSTEADFGYVNPIIVTVPNLAPGTEVFAAIRAILDANPTCFVESISVPITLGGNGRPPAELAGLTHTVPLGSSCIPEPSTWVILSLGATALGCARKFREQKQSVAG